MQDQQTTQVKDALENVSGMRSAGLTVFVSAVESCGLKVEIRLPAKYQSRLDIAINSLAYYM